MTKIAFLFPGQGSQSVGMGKELYANFAEARERFDMAEAATGLPIADLCFEGPMSTLTETVNLQPCVTAVNLATLAVLREKGVEPAVVAGHSLGEFSALCAAGVVSDTDALRLVFKRGELMHRESTKHKGAMAAIIGLDIDAVRELVSEAAGSGVVSVANHNMETQIVITGEPDAVKAASAAAAERGVKVVPLKVSGAWHSELIRGAEAEFTEFLESVEFNAPAIPLFHNITADTCASPSEIRSLMARQLCSPVLWYDTGRKLMAEKIDIFAEIGPGKVLTGLAKKILGKEYPAHFHSINDMKSLEKFMEDAR